MRTSSLQKLISLFSIAILLAVQGCASTGNDDFQSRFENNKRTEAIDEELFKKENSKYLAQDAQGVNSISPMQYEHPIPAKSSSEQLELSNVEDITVAFEELALEEFVNHSLSNILKVNFVVAPNVKFDDKKVTLQIKEKISQRRFLSLFQELLEQNGLGMKIQENIMYIHSSQQRSGRPDLDFGFGRNDGDVPIGSQPVYQLVPLNYIEPQNLHSFLVRLTNAGVEFSNDPNVIALQGKRHDIIRALSVIRMLDVPKILGKKIRYLQMNYIPSGEFIEKVTELLENEGVNIRIGAKFTDLSRQNGVVVHSNNDDVLERILYWQKKLDTPESTDDMQYYMYYPENMEAAKLAEVLAKLINVGKRDSKSDSSSSQSKDNAQSKSTLETGNRKSSKSQGSISAVSEEFSFVSDENRNVIIIYSTASKFKTMLPLLKKLDVSPPQVLIEAKLIEVTLKDEHTQGIEWSLFGGGAKSDIGTSQLSSFSGSFSYTISGVDYHAALVLLEKQNKLKVLSSPRIVVANGESASLNVGQEIPVLSTQAADVDSERILQSIQYRSTGVDLTVQPTVNSSNVVSMQISQNVSETSENGSSGIDSPLILNRSFQTSVIANSGQTLVLGGLIRENNSFIDSQIPLLGDIPIFGRLFSNESKSTSRTELLVLITPRIISNSSDIDDIKKLFIDELTLFE